MTTFGPWKIVGRGKNLALEHAARGYWISAQRVNERWVNHVSRKVWADAWTLGGLELGLTELAARAGLARDVDDKPHKYVPSDYALDENALAPVKP